jgi:flagellar hook-basal body complex protein FliE
MAINPSSAIAAYQRIARQAGEDSGMEPRSTDPGGTFADLVGKSLASAVDIGRKAESLSAQAIAGKADLNEVVQAVTNAEVTLQTVLAVRDRVIQAYQDIIRMPI